MQHPTSILSIWNTSRRLYVRMEHLARFSGLMKMWAIQTAESVREVIFCVS